MIIYTFNVRTINEEISESRTELECLVDRQKTLEKTLKQKIVSTLISHDVTLLADND